MMNRFQFLHLGEVTGYLSRTRHHWLRWVLLLLILLLLLVIQDEAATTQAASGPLTLAQCQTIAEQHQPDLAAARGLVAEATARIKQAKAGHKPQVNVGASETQATYNYAAQAGTSPGLAHQLAGTVSGRMAPYSNAGVNLNIPLLDFGRTKGAVMSAQAQYRAALDNVHTVRNSVLWQVQKSYYTVLAAQAMLQVRQRAVADQCRHLEQAEALHQMGRAPKVDVTRQQVALASAQYDAAQAEADVQVARAGLATAMGMPIGQMPEIANTLGTVQPLPGLDGLTAEAEQRRPDLQALREQVAAVRGEEVTAHAALRPQINFSSFLDFRNLGLPLLYNWGLSEMFSQTLLDGGYRKAHLAEVKQAEQVAQANLASYQLQVHEEVYTAWSDAGVALHKIALANQAAREARENLAQAEGRYRNGVGNSIELADAENLASDSESQVILAQYSYQLAHGRLQQAVGEEAR